MGSQDFKFLKCRNTSNNNTVDRVSFALFSCCLDYHKMMLKLLGLFTKTGQLHRAFCTKPPLYSTKQMAAQNLPVGCDLQCWICFFICVYSACWLDPTLCSKGRDIWVPVPRVELAAFCHLLFFKYIMRRI